MNRTRKTEETDKKLHVAVLVLGDLGRSPRMQYHAASLLEEGHTVSLIGYEGSALIPALCRHMHGDDDDDDGSGSDQLGSLNIIRFSIPSTEILRKLLPVYLIWRVLSLCLYVFHALFVRLSQTKSLDKRRARVDCLLVQNPPAMPLLAVAFVFCAVKGLSTGHRPTLVIDWHNLGFTMLPSPLFSAIARIYERLMAPLADQHFCVTSAMKDFLLQNFNIPEESAHVLCDCPPHIFQPMALDNQHELLSRLHERISQACPKSWYQHLDVMTQTLFTQKAPGGDVTSRPGRPALIISSTSWTPDEDFGILLDALLTLDERISKQQSLLKIVCLVTGKGPQKTYYEEKMSKIAFQNVAAQTLWLEPADYPRLLACADLGVSLHTSTSGIDLPMKVLDCFGCAVPVCAKNFSCLDELVQHDRNGRVFDKSAELATHLWDLLHPLEGQSSGVPPHSFGELARYSDTLKGRTRWRENWKQHALPVLLQASPA